MEKQYIFPVEEGFYMPAEYAPHKGCLMIWPVRPGSWPHGAKKAQEIFSRVITTIALSETVYLLAGKKEIDDVIARFEGEENIRILEIETNDAWARDVGPTFVTNAKGEVRGIDWCFNAWGGTYDGLYAHWEQDDLAAGEICRQLGYSVYDAHPFVLEGGAIHTDGEGTLLVTEACLLSPGRNPQLSKAQIEERLKHCLGISKIIWLPHGIVQDETNEHVDNVCAFVRPGEVVLAWSEEEDDPQSSYSKSCLEVLTKERDAKGRALIVHKLPVPKRPVCITREDLSGLSFEEGEDERLEGERLAASYVNFYLSNGGVLIPQFGDENDAVAVELFTSLFPDRTVYPIPAREILVGGGNIHCITQQIPLGTGLSK